MVRERVGDWRLAWRFVVAGLLAGLIVLAMSSIGLVDRPFYAAQDQLFPGPPPDPSITFIEVDSRSQKALGTFPGRTHTTRGSSTTSRSNIRK